MLRIFFILSFGLLMSCKNGSLKTEKFSNTKTRSIDTVKYTAYRILHSQQTERYTRVDLFLRIDKYGNYLIGKYQVDTIKFFKGQVPDTLLQLIDLTLGNIKSNTSYPYNPAHNYLYDGPTCLIDIQIGNKRNFIDFIPPEANKQLKELSEAIDNFVFAVKQEQIPKFDLSFYKEEILRIDKRSRATPEPIMDSIRFKPLKL
jgi:hypothetical protein